MVGDEFVVVDGSVGLVQSVSARSSTVVGQAGGYRHACSCKEHGLPVPISGLGLKAGGVGSGEEGLEGMYGS